MAYVFPFFLALKLEWRPEIVVNFVEIYLVHIVQSSFRAILVPVANGNGPYPFFVDVPTYTRSLFSNEVLTQSKAIAMKYSHKLKSLQNQL